MSFLRVSSQDKSAYPTTTETHLRVSQKHAALSHLYGNDAEPVRVLFGTPPTTTATSEPSYHSVSDSSTIDFNNHRQLHGSKPKPRPNARIRLHNDLLRNGYYSMWLWIGTPPHRFALIVDTRSTVTYVPCFTSQHCGNHQILARMGVVLLSEPVTEIMVIAICFVIVCDGDMVNELRFSTKAMIQIYKSLYRTHFLGFTGW